MKLLKQILSLQLVMALSISLLLFIGVGESYRVAPSLLLTNVCNQAQLLKGNIETNLKLGVPITFSGFNDQANNLASQSKQIVNANISVNDIHHGTPQLIKLTCDMTDKTLLRVINIDWLGLIRPTNTSSKYLIILNLDNKINSVAKLVITPVDGLFSNTINQQFKPVFILAFMLVFLLPIVISLVQNFTVKHSPLMQKGLYHLAFVIVGVVVIKSQVFLYSTEIKEQSYSMARSLEARLSEAVDLKFDIESEFSGIDELLSEYLHKNEDISHIYLLNKGVEINKAVIEPYVNQTKLSHCDTFNSAADSNKYITTCMALGKSQYQIVVKTPWSKVYSKLWNATRNILVLFVASILLSNLFLDVLLSVQKSIKSKNTITNDEKTSSQETPEKLLHMLQLIRPVFALAVLMEAVNLSFLPGYFTDKFSDSEYTISTVFGAYFICFAAILIPAGRWAEAHSLRNMMLFALILSAVGLGGMAFTELDVNIILLRCIAGTGQGILFIAVQSYLLKLESQQSDLRGTEQLVIGFNISTISGATIGALLMPIMGEQGVFIAGATIGFTCSFYCLLMIKDFNTNMNQTLNLHAITKDVPSGWLKIKLMAKDIELYKSILLVGFPSKALYVGVLIFIMPILLKELDFDTDAIGQILIFYYFGVLISTLLLSRTTYFEFKAKLVLFIGNVGSGIGLIVIGSLHWFQQSEYVLELSLQNQEFILAFVIMCGVLLVGLSHGFIHAPIVSYVVQSKNSQLVGKATTAATYRFIERIGHIMGPYLAFLLLLNNDGSTKIEVLIIIGSFIVFFGFIFLANKNIFSNEANK